MEPPTKMPNLTEQTKIFSSTKTSKPAITFLDLPQEILHMITALLDEKQVPILRLISKQAWYRLSDVFAKVHFAHLHHHLTEPSLQDLIHITSHAMFSTYIKSIEFSTVRTKSPSYWSESKILNSLYEEDITFREHGSHIKMLVTVLKNLKRRGNHKVSLGVFDSLCRNKDDLARAIDDFPTWHATLGHGYIESYGVDNVPTGAHPHGTMFAISQAANISEYPLKRLSITTADRSSTKTKLITKYQANLLLKKGSNQFKSGLTLKYVVVSMKKIKRCHHIQERQLNVEVETGAHSHLSLQGQPWAINGRKYIQCGALQTWRHLRYLPSAFAKTKYQKLTLKDLQLNHYSVTWLCSRTKQQTFKYLEISSIDVWVEKDVDDSALSAFTFLNHFKRSYNIKKLEISNLVVNAAFSLDGESHIYRKRPQPLRLAAEEIVAEGYDQVQRVFDDLTTQISTWRDSFGRN